MTLVAAALVPESVLLLPGAAGRADPLASERAAVDDVLRHLLDARPARILLVAAGATRRVAVPEVRDDAPYGVRRTLGALGLSDALLHDADAPTEGGEVLHEPAAVVALTLLRDAGGAGPVEVHLVETAADAEPLGAQAEADDDDVALLMVGSLSARRGPDAPLAEDSRAADVDRRALRALTRLSAKDVRWLREVDGLAQELAMSAVVPWAALAGAAAAGAVLQPSGHPQMTAPLGADLVVMGWVRSTGGTT